MKATQVELKNISIYSDISDLNTYADFQEHDLIHFMYYAHTQSRLNLKTF